MKTDHTARYTLLALLGGVLGGILMSGLTTMFQKPEPPQKPSQDARCSSDEEPNERT